MGCLHLFIPYETRTTPAMGGMKMTVTSVFCPRCGFAKKVDPEVEQ